MDPTTVASGAAPDEVAHYRIVRQIGRGGQATVYLAYDTKIERDVALKVLDSGARSHGQAIDRFRREAGIASRLNHPGICPVYEHGEERGVLWIAMRYVEGRTLAEEITAARSRGTAEAGSFALTPEDASETRDAAPLDHQSSGPNTWSAIETTLAFFEKAARALHSAHEAGIVHRDIKPGNLMMTAGGEPVILDFGLAQEVDGDQPVLTLTGDIMGTPAYMSPEQIAAQRIRLDRRTDVYSLGVALYECLTLRRPFHEPTRERLYQAILTKNPTDVRELNPALTADVKVVLATALEKDRDRRYQTARDFADDIERLRKRGEILAKPIGPLVHLVRWSRRNRALAASVAALFAMLAAGLAVALFLLNQRDRALGEKAKALQDVTLERNEKEAARSSLAVSVADYDRLGDSSRLQQLQAEADGLWPCDSARVAAMKEWVERGTDLEQRLGAHRGALERVRASPGLLPYTDDDRADDARRHGAERNQVARLRAEREALASMTATESSSKPAPVEGMAAKLAGLDAEIARLDAIIGARMIWRFQSSADQFKHDTTAKLAAGLAAFVDPDPKVGLLADVRARLAFAETVEDRTIRAHEAEWAAAIRSIADAAACPRYAGMRIQPQSGLIPIGRDPASGLWEFVHLQTVAPGTEVVPRRDATGRVVVTEGMGLVFVLLPQGTFRMGATRPESPDTLRTEPNVDADAVDAESPVTEVALDAFFLSKYEMSQGQWERIVRRNPSEYGPWVKQANMDVDLRNPVEQVSWEDCDRWLGRLGLVIPAEAQWEYAARAGTTTPRWIGIGTDGLEKAANLADQVLRSRGGLADWSYESWDDGYALHAPVGSFAANPFGLYDVLGNVHEWCRDWYGPYTVAARAGDGLRSPPPRRTRVLRGGTWRYTSSSARSASRTTAPPETRAHAIGVRPARTLR